MGVGSPPVVIRAEAGLDAFSDQIILIALLASAGANAL